MADEKKYIKAWNTKKPKTKPFITSEEGLILLQQAKGPHFQKYSEAEQTGPPTVEVKKKVAAPVVVEEIVVPKKPPEDKIAAKVTKPKRRVTRKKK